ncbi:class I SAM-dependent methyltransferase [Mycolicibacterium holsaticum]|uniref:class I SAM-dependent methyltransferase n=1 Tax=Mycolicibacterium holsaticum TaxID=152142 RepID=UPI0013F4CD76|nr:class I SAM-dependent methyltransferase [Mycolicibacterium holsaticum]
MPTYEWTESKYCVDGPLIRASKNQDELPRSSRIVADLVGEFYSMEIPKRVSGDLADLGCGKAPLLGAYRHRCASFLLADWDHSPHANPLPHVSVNLNEPLKSFNTNTFDVVILSDVLEHIREPQRLMCEISRILKPGGYLLLNVPFAYRIHEAPHDYYRYTRFALERFVQQSEMEVVKLVPLGGWIEVMADQWCKLLAYARMPLLVVLIHRIAIAFHRTALGRRLSARGGEALPLGYGLVARKPKAAKFAGD